MTTKKFNSLIRQIKNNRKALTEIYKYYYPLIVIHINYNFHGKLDGRDIAHQFFLELFQMQIPEYINYPASWIYKITDNIAIKKLHKDDKRKTAEAEAAAEEKTLDKKEDGIEILNCLEARERKIIYLHYWEGYAFKEIATILQMNYSTLKSAHKKAKTILKKSIQKEKQNEKD